MCRSIKTLYHLDPPTDAEEIHAASRQFVRKVSGFTKPSQKNETVFERAVEEIAQITARLLPSCSRHRSLTSRRKNVGREMRPVRFFRDVLVVAVMVV